MRYVGKFTLVLWFLLSWSGPLLCAPMVTDPLPSDTKVSAAFSRFVWCETAPDGKTSLMLVASVDENDGVLLTGHSLGPEEDCDCPRRSFELHGFTVSVLVDLKVYRDPNRQMLYAVLTGGGASTGGVWIVGISGTGSARTLFEDMSRVEPGFRIWKGIPEVRELWEIARLMGHRWRPTREFAGHVLVERIYRLGQDGKFHLEITRPATEDEKRLSKQDFQRLLRDRRDFESSFPESKASHTKSQPGPKAK